MSERMDEVQRRINEEMANRKGNPDNVEIASLRTEVSNLRGTVRLHKERAETLSARVEELEGLASSYLAAAAQVGGCVDGGCAVLRPTGMHTNGGCRCTYNMDRARERGVSRLLMMAQHMARAALEGK